MSNAVVLTIVLSILASNLGVVLAIVWYFGITLGARVDRLEAAVQTLREDVAVLKATR